MKNEGLVITAVFPKHVDVATHRSYTTMADVERKKEKKAEKEEEERNKVKEMGIKELWKPYQQSGGLFEETGNKCVPFSFYPV